MEGCAGTGPQTAAIIQKWRSRLKLSKQRFAELADISATYVRTLEAGRDDDDRPVVPSAGIIQKLARGLGRAGATPAEERQIYAELMVAAGYVDPTAIDSLAPPGFPAPALPPAPAAQPADPAPAASNGRHPTSTAGAADELAAGRAPTPDAGADALIILRDQRLRAHLVPLLAQWDALTSDDQALLLGIAEFVHTRRRPAGPPAGPGSDANPSTGK